MHAMATVTPGVPKERQMQNLPPPPVYTPAKHGCKFIHMTITSYLCLLAALARQGPLAKSPVHICIGKTALL